VGLTPRAQQRNDAAVKFADNLRRRRIRLKLAIRAVDAVDGFRVGLLPQLVDRVSTG